MQNLGGQRECIMGRGIRKQSILTKNGIYVIEYSYLSRSDIRFCLCKYRVTSRADVIQLLRYM